MSEGADGVEVSVEATPTPAGTVGDRPPQDVGHDRVGLVVVIAVAVVATLGSVPWLGKSMFADEGASLYSARLSWSDLWAQSTHVDLVMLPYYVVLHFWMLVSWSIAWAHALSLLAYGGTVLVVGVLGLRLAGRWCGIVAAVLTATSTLLVLKALNARPYELSALAVALCAVALVEWLRDPRLRWMWAFSLLAVLATAAQLFAVLAPISMLVCVLAVRPALFTERIRSLLAPIATLLVLVGVWVVAAVGQVGQVNWIASGSAESRLLAEARGPAVGQLYDLVLFVIVVIVVAKLAAIWDEGVREVVVQRIRHDRDVLALTFGWAVLPTVALSIASIAHPIFADRYVTASAPGVALLIALVCVRTLPITRRTAGGPGEVRVGAGWLGVLAVAGAVAVGVLVTGYLSSASAIQEDLQGTAGYVALHAHPTDRIALPDHALTTAIGYYLARDKRLVPLWPQTGVRQRYVEGFDLLSDRATAGPGSPRVWLVTDGSVPGVAQFQRMLLQDHYSLLKQVHFTGVTLLLYHSAQKKHAHRGRR